MTTGRIKQHASSVIPSEIKLVEMWLGVLEVARSWKPRDHENKPLRGVCLDEKSLPNHYTLLMLLAKLGILGDQKVYE